MTQTNPEQWAVELAGEVLESYGDCDVTKYIAALAIQAAFAEREARLVGALESAGNALAWAESRMSAETYAIVIRNDLRNVRAALKDRTHG